LCDALVVAQVVQPRIAQERLDESPLLRSVFIHLPTIRAVAAALAAEVFERVQKGLALLRIDVIPDRHEHRPTIGIEVAAGHCGRPMHCRRQVQVRAGLELPAPLRPGGDRAPGSGGEERWRETEARSDLTPDEAAEAERAEHHR